MNRPDVFVYIGLVMAWIVVAAWTYRIARKADRLRLSVDQAPVNGRTAEDAS